MIRIDLDKGRYFEVPDINRRQALRGLLFATGGLAFLSAPFNWGTELFMGPPGTIKWTLPQIKVSGGALRPSLGVSYDDTRGYKNFRSIRDEGVFDFSAYTNPRIAIGGLEVWGQAQDESYYNKGALYDVYNGYDYALFGLGNREVFNLGKVPTRGESGSVETILLLPEVNNTVCDGKYVLAAVNSESVSLLRSFQIRNSGG